MSTAAVLSDFFTAALREARSERPASLASRIPALDELTEGGFPVNALTELFIPHAGIGEVRMLLPALASLKHVTWVLPCDSEAAPYAPALADAGLDLDRQLFSIPSTPEEAFWCAEQAANLGRRRLAQSARSREGRCGPRKARHGRALDGHDDLPHPPLEHGLHAVPCRTPSDAAAGQVRHRTRSSYATRRILRPHAGSRRQSGGKAPRSRPARMPPQSATGSRLGPSLSRLLNAALMLVHQGVQLMNIATCAKTSLKAVVSVPVGIRLQELPSMVKSLCAGIAGNADCSGGELTLTLEGLDETRRIVVSVNNGSARAFTDVLTDRLIRTPIPGSLRRMTLSLEPEISDLIRDTPNASVPTGLAARLQARLGPGRVFRLSNLDEGLPSTSSRLAPVADAFARKPMSAPAGKADVRPTMLLSDPLPLHASDDGLAWRQESLRLVDGPVRHADDSEIRDYFVAESSSGRRVWLYRTEDSDKTEVRWHLHGFFS